MRRLYVAARAPRAGEAKTRLGATVGHDAAARLYGAFLADLSERLRAARLPVAWSVTPGSWPAVSPLVGGGRHREQRGDTWGQRQANLFRDAGAAGECPVVLIASDSPHLELEAVQAAFAALERVDIVLGPTLDGGYYLVGPGPAPDLLARVEMGRSDVLRQVMRRARRLGLRTATVPPTFDVDTAEDLEALAAEVGRRTDLPATAAVLDALSSADPAAARPEQPDPRGPGAGGDRCLNDWRW